MILCCDTLISCHFYLQIYSCNGGVIQPILCWLFFHFNGRPMHYCLHSCFGNSLQIVHNILSITCSNLTGRIVAFDFLDLSLLYSFHFRSSAQSCVEHFCYHLQSKCKAQGTSGPTYNKFSPLERVETHVTNEVNHS